MVTDLNFLKTEVDRLKLQVAAHSTATKAHGAAIKELTEVCRSINGQCDQLATLVGRIALHIPGEGDGR